MDIINRINPMIASLENTLGECITALNEGLIDVQMVANTIGTVQQALSKLRPIIGQLAAMDEEKSFALCSVKDVACELYFSLDETSQHYASRPHAEIVELVLSLFECFPDAPPTDSNNVVMFPVKGSVTP